MKNISIYAHFDKDNIIDDYVIYYLNELKAVSEYVVFVSDCDLSDEELSKLRGIADFTLAHKHGEYDFGSYKRGWEIVTKSGLLDDVQTLTFANDSCYGPFYPLAPIYEKMNAKDCDFWGITSNKNYLEGKFYPCPESENRHVQSYFMVFKKQVFESDVFKEFMNGIKKEEDKFKIIEKYEIGLTKLLCSKKFKFNVKSCSVGVTNFEDIISLSSQSPFIFMKVSCIRNITWLFLMSIFINKLKNNTKYRPDYITKHYKRFRHNFNVYSLKLLRKTIVRIRIREREFYLFGIKHEI